MQLHQLVKSVYYGYVHGPARALGLDRALRMGYRRANGFSTRMRYELFWKDKILTRERLRSEAHTVWEFGEQETVDIDDIGEHVNLDEYRYIEGDAPKRFTLDPPFVAELRDVTILDGTGDAVTRDGEFVMDVKAHAIGSILNVVKERARDAVEIPLSDEFDFEVAVSFCGAVRRGGSLNYWAWVHHYLTRLEGVATYRAETGIDPVIILPDGAPRFAWESLKFFGFGDSVVEWDPAQRLRVERLIVPSNRFPERMGAEHMLLRVVSPSAARWLREEVLNQLSNTNFENRNRLLISRDDVGYRKMQLNNGTIEQLKSLGFCKIELANMPFEKQMRMFVNAKIILGPHGAGFANSIFSKETLLIEINGDILRPSYYFMSQCLDNHYRSVRGQSLMASNSKKFDQDIEMGDEFISVIEDVMKLHKTNC